MKKTTIGIVGARGYTGRELLRLLADHDGFELTFASSRKLEGTPVSEHVPPYDTDVVFQEITPEDLVDDAPEAVVLALPNDVSGPFVEAIDQHAPDTRIVDISADHRFDPEWRYGQTERFREEIRHASRLANPGCYATGAQLALAPFIDLFDCTPKVFGVSGYSGAGTNPSPKNDPEKLRDNLMPYRLTGHTHEREVSRHIDHPIHFTPHVASFFRGIMLTVSFDLLEQHTVESLMERLYAAYGDEPLVELEESAPQVRDNTEKHHVALGGIEVAKDGHHAVLVATLDNLLKGAATQALQNLNLMCGYDELHGIK